MSAKTELRGNSMARQDGEMGRSMSCGLKPFPQLRESGSGGRYNIKEPLCRRALQMAPCFFENLPEF
jgi:hypothetical protein